MIDAQWILSFQALILWYNVTKCYDDFWKPFEAVTYLYKVLHCKLYVENVSPIEMHHSIGMSCLSGTDSDCRLFVGVHYFSQLIINYTVRVFYSVFSFQANVLPSEVVP